MDIYKSRPKINSKIIFKNISSKVNNCLVIGNNNSDIVEVLKSKDISIADYLYTEEKEIIKFLESLDKNKFEVIIFNYELSNIYNIKTIINLLVEKSNYSLIRFRNHNNNNKKSKKKYITKTLKKDNINIFKKVYGKKNIVSSCFLFKPIAYYSVYFISKNRFATNLILSPIEKIKNYLNSFNKNIAFTSEIKK